jgi:IGR protein motif
MITRNPSTILSLLRTTATSPTAPYICTTCRRHLHNASNRPAQSIPPPTPFVPDVPTFLTLIGRQLKSHASKFSSWDELFTLSSPQLKSRGLEPPRTRRYLLRWRDKFRRGEYGIGGDLQFVNEEGIAELRVCEVPALPKPTPRQSETTSSETTASTETSSPPPKPHASTSHTPGTAKLILNLPPGSKTYESALSAGQTSKDLKKPTGMSLKEGHIIIGSYVAPMAGSNGSAATIRVTEGMWEHRRGHKVHGGERRRAETLHKLKVEQRRKERR